MDRFIRGFIIEAATSAIKDTINLLNYYVFHIANTLYADMLTLWQIC